MLPLFSNEAEPVSLLLRSTAGSNVCLFVTHLGEAYASKLLVARVIMVYCGESSLYMSIK